MWLSCLKFRLRDRWIAMFLAFPSKLYCDASLQKGSGSVLSANNTFTHNLKVKEARLDGLCRHGCSFGHPCTRAMFTIAVVHSPWTRQCVPSYTVRKRCRAGNTVEENSVICSLINTNALVAVSKSRFNVCYNSVSVCLSYVCVMYMCIEPASALEPETVSPCPSPDRPDKGDTVKTYSV